MTHIIWHKASLKLVINNDSPIVWVSLWLFILSRALKWWCRPGFVIYNTRSPTSSFFLFLVCCFLRDFCAHENHPQPRPIFLSLFKKEKKEKIRLYQTGLDSHLWFFIHSFGHLLWVISVIISLQSLCNIKGIILGRYIILDNSYMSEIGLDKNRLTFASLKVILKRKESSSCGMIR